MSTHADLRGPAVTGALCAAFAALAGIGAHGLADRSMSGHVPGFDALCLLTVGVLALGAATGAVASMLAARANIESAAVEALSRRPGISRLAFLVAPVTAGQWFSHIMLSADHKAQVLLAAASGAAPESAAAAASSAHAHAHGSGHVHAQGPVSVAQLSALAPVDVPHEVHWLPMFAAHALGVTLCIAVFALLDRVFAWSARTLACLTVPAPRPLRVLRPRRSRAAALILRPHTAHGSRGPPAFLAP